MFIKQNPQWSKLWCNQTLPNMPNNHIQVNLEDYITYSLITQLPDQPVSPVTKEQETNSYVVKNPYETPSPNLDEERLNLTAGLIPILTQLSLKWILEET